MRRLLALILAALLLTGCAPSQPIHTDPPATTGSEPQENLQQLPDEAVGSMVPRQLLGTQAGLLLCSADTLRLLSWEDLSVIAETPISASDLAYVQVLDGGISIADPERQTVTLLDNALTETTRIPCDAGTKTWLLSPDGDALYTLSHEGLRVWNLEDGTSRELLRSRMMTVASLTTERVYVGAVPETDLMIHWYALELDQGTLTELTGAPAIAIQEGLMPQSNGARLKADRHAVTQYDADGRFVSSCTLPEDVGSPGRDFIWSDSRQGWFFLTYDAEGCHLLFWDPAVPTTGEDADIQPETVPEGEILPRELYDRAEALSQRFDLDIRIADRAIRDYNSYSSEMLTDPEVTAHALDILEEALSEYPEGFFTQLKYGNRHAVRIELVDALAAKSGKDVSSTTSAFTTRLDRCSMLVLNGQQIRESVIFHEISHIVDKCLEWDSQIREDALYSEEGWMALQPEGFEYAGSYTNVPISVQKFYDSGYFVREYSCVSASEDRAMLLEKAMLGDQATFDANPHLMPKLEYYCKCIRDSFNTEGWPETTRWERLLP